MAILGLMLIPLKSFNSAWVSCQNALLSLNRIETIENIPYYYRKQIFIEDDLHKGYIKAKNAYFTFNYVFFILNRLKIWYPQL